MICVCIICAVCLACVGRYNELGVATCICTISTTVILFPVSMSIEIPGVLGVANDVCGACFACVGYCIALAVIRVSVGCIVYRSCIICIVCNICVVCTVCD